MNFFLKIFIYLLCFFTFVGFQLIILGLALLADMAKPEALIPVIGFSAIFAIPSTMVLWFDYFKNKK